MDEIAKFPDMLTYEDNQRSTYFFHAQYSWLELILFAAIDAFVPLLENSQAEFEKVHKETFTYGDLTRHQVNRFLIYISHISVAEAFRVGHLLSLYQLHRYF